MEHVQRQVALGHAVDKAVHRRFVIVSGEGGGQPQAERPRRRQCRTAGELRIAVQHLFRRRAVDHEVLQIFPFHAELYFGDLLGADFKRDVLGVIHQHAVAAVGQVERDVFVGLLGAGAAVAVPGFDRLAVAHQGGKALAQTVDRFPHAQIQTFKHIVAIGVGILHVAVVFQLAAGNALAVAQEIQRPELAFGDAHADAAAFQFDKFGVVFNPDLHVFQDVQRIVRAVVQCALEVLNAHPDNRFLRGKQAHREHQRVELPGAFAHVTRRHIHHQVIALLLHVEHLHRIGHIQARLNKPVSITDFHAYVLLVLQFFADRQVFKLLLVAARALRQLAQDFGQERGF